MKYFIIECRDINHRFGPNIQKIIWNENNILVCIEATERGKDVQVNLNGYIGQTVPFIWKEEHPYNYPTREMTNEEIFLEFL